jgi:hypothetical protein
MLISSMTRRSHSSGFSTLWEKPPCLIHFRPPARFSCSRLGSALRTLQSRCTAVYGIVRAISDGALGTEVTERLESGVVFRATRPGLATPPRERLLPCAPAAPAQVLRLHSPFARAAFGFTLASGLQRALANARWSQ